MSFTDENKLLFSLLDVTEIVHSIASQMEREVDRISADDFRTMLDGDLVQRIVQRHTVEPLALVSDSIGLMSHAEVAVGPNGESVPINDSFRPGGWVRGIRAMVALRYTGPENLWQFKPTPDWSKEIRGNVQKENDHGGYLELIFNIPGPNAEVRLRERIDAELEKIRSGVAALRPVIERWNESLAEHAAKAVAERRAFLNILERLPEIIEIPLIERRDRVPYEEIALRPAMVEPVGTTSNVSQAKRYVISEGGYQRALHIIRHFGRSFEQMPAAVAPLPEEQLRDLFLAALSTYFSSVSGERFRRKGKTDILIEEATRAAFVAECKLWRGEKSLEEAIRQITDLYTVWYDCKCAILLFNRTRKDVTRVVEAIEAYRRNHPLLVGSVASTAPGEWEAHFHRRDDPNNVLRVELFLFDVRDESARRRRHGGLKAPRRDRAARSGPDDPPARAADRARRR